MNERFGDGYRKVQGVCAEACTVSLLLAPAALLFLAFVTKALEWGAH